MTKNSVSSNWRFTKILGVFVLFFFVIFASELIYQLNHSPQYLFYTYFKNVSVSYSPGYFGKTYNGFVAKSFYTYFSYLDKLYPPGKACSPFCLQYQEEQMYLGLFKRLLPNDALRMLTNDEKARLYFWMANINIWHPDDQTTLEWLEKGLSLRLDEEYKMFYEDLRDVNLIDSNLSIREYFIRKLNSVDENAPRYQKIYLAKASYNLAMFFLNSGDLDQANKFILTSVSFNPWNIDYYLLLSDTYLKKNDIKRAEETLSECIVKIPKDSGLCKKLLTTLYNQE